MRFQNKYISFHSAEISKTYATLDSHSVCGRCWSQLSLYMLKGRLLFILSGSHMWVVTIAAEWYEFVQQKRIRGAAVVYWDVSVPTFFHAACESVYPSCVLMCLNFVCSVSLTLLTLRCVQQVSWYIPSYQKHSCDTWTDFSLACCTVTVFVCVCVYIFVSTGSL